MQEPVKRFPRYSKLLRLYPPTYRRRYGEQMLQTLADMLDNAPDGRSRAMIWLRTIADTPLSILQQQVSYVGHTLTTDTPGYVKRNSVVGGLLLVPFFGLVAVNDLSAHHLYNTWLWRFPVLFTCIVVLPALALTLSAATFAAWAFQQRKRGGWWRSLLDIHHNWPMLTLVALGAGILGLVFFHDSVHCVLGNPLQEAREWHQTVQCIRQR